jgi:O-antigen/teichoic acid export membrane protein
MKSRQILINAIMSVVQTISLGVILFVLYRFLVGTIGMKGLGIWSLILATTSVAQIANLGIATSVTKLVAKYTATKEHDSVSGVIETSTVSLGSLTGFVLLIIYPVLKKILAFVVDTESLPQALTILPHAVTAFWLMTLLSIFQAALDGLQRIDLRSTILIGSAILNLILCVLLAPTHGLIGVAYARLAQTFLTLVVAWVVLKFYVKLSILPWRCNRKLFGEMIRYGVKYQTISVATMLYDPLTKAMLSKFGGLSMVGYYEMINRLIQQFRALMVSTNQVLFPTIAELYEYQPDKINSIYTASYQLLFYLSVPMLTIVIIFLPALSQVWIGQHESIFVNFGIFLSLGWLLNTLSSPAYFTYLGTGKLRWNIVGHIAIGAINVILGLLFGLLFGGYGVVLAWAI